MSSSYAPSILSSLGIKGASSAGGDGKSGMAAVLSEGGRLDASMLPSGVDWSSYVSSYPIYGVMFVDGAYTGSSRDGSMSKPCLSVSEALSLANSLASVPQYLSVFLSPGQHYETSQWDMGSVQNLRIEGLGGGASVSMEGGGSLVLSGSVPNSSVSIANSGFRSNLYVSYNIKLAEISGGSNVLDIEQNLVTDQTQADLLVRIDPSSVCSNTNAAGIEYSGAASRVGISASSPWKSSSVASVEAALSAVHSKPVSVGYSSFSGSASGISEGQAVSSGQTVGSLSIDMSEAQRQVAEAANASFVKPGDSISTPSVSISGGGSSATLSFDGSSVKSGSSYLMSATQSGKLPVSAAWASAFSKRIVSEGSPASIDYGWDGSKNLTISSSAGSGTVTFQNGSVAAAAGLTVRGKTVEEISAVSAASVASSYRGVSGEISIDHTAKTVGLDGSVSSAVSGISAIRSTVSANSSDISMLRSYVSELSSLCDSLSASVSALATALASSASTVKDIVASHAELISKYGSNSFSSGDKVIALDASDDSSAGCKLAVYSWTGSAWSFIGSADAYSGSGIALRSENCLWRLSIDDDGTLSRERVSCGSESEGISNPDA